MDVLELRSSEASADEQFVSRLVSPCHERHGVKTRTA